ncbi:4290_t:CDS:2, partial [Ambispora gerdemannii]
MSAQFAQSISPTPAVEERNEDSSPPMEIEEDASENYDAALLGGDNSSNSTNSMSLSSEILGLGGDNALATDNSSSLSSSGILVPSNETSPLTQSLNSSQILITLNDDNDADSLNRDNYEDGSFVDAEEEIGNESARLDENTASENYEATLERPEEEQELRPVSANSIQRQPPPTKEESPKIEPEKSQQAKRAPSSSPLPSPQAPITTTSITSPAAKLSRSLDDDKENDHHDKRSNHKLAVILNTTFDIALAGLFVGWLVSRRSHVGKQSLGIGTVGLTIVYGAQ